MSSRVVWKHKLPTIYDQPFPLSLPRGARVLSVQMQAGELVLWELHDAPSASMNAYPEVTERRFIVTGTGILFAHREEILIPRATLQLDNGALVLHVFEVEDLLR